MKQRPCKPHSAADRHATRVEIRGANELRSHVVNVGHKVTSGSIDRPFHRTQVDAAANDPSPDAARAAARRVIPPARFRGAPVFDLRWAGAVHQACERFDVHTPRLWGPR